MKFKPSSSTVAFFGAVIIITIVVVGYFKTVPLVVIGTSMYPTINEGDVLIAIKTPSTYDNLERGDIVSTRVDDVHYIKRVIGLSGDTVEINKGVLYVNGEAVDEPYINKLGSSLEISNYSPVEVPEDHYFIMGDNRLYSSDSRDLGVFHKDAFHRKLAFHLKVGKEDANNGVPQ